MERIIVGYIVKTFNGETLELTSATGSDLKTDTKRSAEFYSSRLYIGGSTTVFESRRAAKRAIARTKKAVAGTKSYLDGIPFEIERLTAYLPFGIDTTAQVTVTPAN